MNYALENGGERITIDRMECAASVIDPQFLNKPQVEFDFIAQKIGTPLLLEIETLNQFVHSKEKKKRSGIKS